MKNNKLNVLSIMILIIIFMVSGCSCSDNGQKKEENETSHESQIDFIESLTAEDFKNKCLSKLFAIENDEIMPGFTLEDYERFKDYPKYKDINNDPFQEDDGIHRSYTVIGRDIGDGDYRSSYELMSEDFIETGRLCFFGKEVAEEYYEEHLNICNASFVSVTHLVYNNAKNQNAVQGIIYLKPEKENDLGLKPNKVYKRDIEISFTENVSCLETNQTGPMIHRVVGLEEEFTLTPYKELPDIIAR
ncbi:hypothetical protein SYNTR_1217 [Candidatus Syntrophocurvum alkaliphilum]|uniref:Lipoprotein n=1 Tax=Candidatus Syntrophocurvum alkaliphilum TaxID=2293317 RepID=A0A6I6DHI9_9FIRM|nr:hypothetical protein [Candidatus Syntrophocurvum alkaliphilum]QGT99810.1 hypothetical protein SYNTR_1217 [Candidatus Syntrophocurvum alkaliphilum]